MRFASCEHQHWGARGQSAVAGLEAATDFAACPFNECHQCPHGPLINRGQRSGLEGLTPLLNCDLANLFNYKDAAMTDEVHLTDLEGTAVAELHYVHQMAQSQSLATAPGFSVLCDQGQNLVSKAGSTVLPSRKPFP